MKNDNIKDAIEAMTVLSNANIEDLLRGIADGEVGAALVVEPETGKFVDIYTDGDVRRALLDGNGLKTPIAFIQKDQPVTATSMMTSEEISTLFTTAVRVIPILDSCCRVVNLGMFDKRIHLPVAEPFFDTKELQNITECILTGWVSSSGKFVKQFEDQFADFCGTKHAISTCNGTAALHLSILACNIGPGDEVIVPSLTFIATANAVRYAGATPIFVDCEPDTWNIDPICFEKAVTSKTKAVIPVHLYGHPANMDLILNIAQKNNLFVIEDAAEAHGALYNGKNVGSIGDLGIFSFFGNKIITTGEGGMVVTDNDEMAQKMRIMRDHGMDTDRRYWHTVLGYNYRMTNLQASIGVAQLERIDTIIAKKRYIAQLYKRLLTDVEGVILPIETEYAKSVFWLYSILIEEEKFGLSRDALILKFKEHGIGTRPLFPPVHSQPIYMTGQVLPVSERVSLQGLSLPSSPKLIPSDIERVADVIRQK